ncbi:uncharacterized protein [Amphiura filiformis]|uniref:uncharacterized protein n=1 Tax=Amphiura filiformis TaxID=82378 RepID=UPI003B21B9FC
MRYIENAELREWIKETLRKNIFQKAHALAIQTGCDILVKLEDKEDDRGSQYYATSTLENVFSGHGLQKKPQDLSVSGDTGLPICPLVDRAIQSCNEQTLTSSRHGTDESSSSADDIGQIRLGRISAPGSGSDEAIPMQLTVADVKNINSQSESVQTTEDSAQDPSQDPNILVRVKMEPAADDEPPDPGVVDNGETDSIETQQKNTDEMSFSLGQSSSPSISGNLSVHVDGESRLSSLRQVHIPISPKPYQCALCHKAFKSVQVLQKHTQTFHMKPQSGRPLSRRGRDRGRGTFARRSSPQLASQTEPPRYLCTACYKVFNGPQQLEDHIVQCHMDSATPQKSQHQTSFDHSLSLAGDIPFPPLEDENPVNSGDLEDIPGPSTSGQSVSQVTPRGTALTLRKKQSSASSPFAGFSTPTLLPKSRSSPQQGSPLRLVGTKLKKRRRSSQPQMKPTVTMFDVNQSLVWTPSGKVDLEENVKFSLYAYAKNPNIVARKLASMLFTTQERVKSNCMGSKGQDRMDPIRMQLLKSTVFEVCGITPDEQIEVWKAIKLAVDASNRVVRFNLNKDTSGGKNLKKRCPGRIPTMKESRTMQDVNQSLAKLPGGYIALRIHVKESLVPYAGNMKTVTRMLATRLFTVSERVNGNCTGGRGKNQLDHARLELLKSTVFEVCGVSYAERDKVWKDIKAAVDAANRHVRSKYPDYPRYESTSVGKKSKKKCLERVPSVKQSTTMQDVDQYLIKLSDGNIALKEHVKESMLPYAGSIKTVTRMLATKLFMLSERVSGNCKGIRGQVQLDLDRLELLKSTVFEVCGVSYAEQDKVWRNITAVVDAANRHVRFKNACEKQALDDINQLGTVLYGAKTD